jgi:hypothetical protein
MKNGSDEKKKERALSRLFAAGSFPHPGGGPDLSVRSCSVFMPFRFRVWVHRPAPGLQRAACSSRILSERPASY